MKMKMTDWISKAQSRLQERAAARWAAFLETDHGQSWRRRQYIDRETRRYRYLHDRDTHSPYYFGFSLPQAHHDLVDAIGKGDEARAKAIMLFDHYFTD
jgi:DNA-binding GntR family transcriptional regulator